jgi:DeoR family transcriptional regulator of aga operon
MRCPPGTSTYVGLTTPGILEAQSNTLMIRVSREVTAVADSSKLRRRSLSVIDKIQALHRLITDTGAGPAAVAELRGRGIEAITA